MLWLTQPIRQRTLTSRMHIRVDLPRARLRHWHLALIHALEAEANASVSVHLCDGQAPAPRAVSLLLSLDALLQAGSDDGLLAPLTSDALAAYTSNSDQSAKPDLVLSIGCDRSETGPHPAVCLLFDGLSHEDAMWHALLERRTPRLGLKTRGPDGDDDGPPANILAWPALEAPHSLSASGAAVVSRAIDILVDAVQRRSQTPGRDQPTHLNPLNTEDGFDTAAWHETSWVHTQKSLAFFSRRVADKASAVLMQLLKTGPRWHAGWRSSISIDPQRHTVLNAADIRPLAASATSYFADPFPLTDGDTTYVFMEEVPFATNRGHICVVGIGADRTVSEPRPVLDTGSHLSYPHVFRHNDDIWMVPESSASGGVDLYRADPFPHHWHHEARLITEPAHDATLHFDGTRWWMFATVQRRASSTWCGLKLYTAETLRGPWRACCDDAYVKIDATSARPAGPVMSHNGALYRPTQNCANGYGDSLTWCRIEHLAIDGFRETQVGAIRFDKPDIWRGPHTWAAAHNLAVVDLFAAPRYAPQ